MAINRFNDGDVLYAAPLNQMVDEINNNAEESASIKADLTELSDSLELSIYDFIDGKFWDINYSQFVTVSNSNSRYINPIDVSAFKGHTISIIVNAYGESSERLCGFCGNSDGSDSTDFYPEKSDWEQTSDGKYKKELTVSSKYFVASFSKTVTEISIIAKAPRFYTKVETDSIIDEAKSYVDKGVSKVDDFNSKLSAWGIRHSYNSNFEKMNLPSDDVVDFNEFPISIITDGHNYDIDFDVSIYRSVGGTTYYVSPKGTTSASGLDEEHPINTFWGAYRKVNSGDTICLMDGVYDVNRWTDNVNIEKSINIVAKNDGKVVVKLGQNLSFNHYSGNAYYSPITSVTYVFENYNDNIVKLKRVSSIDDVVVTKGTWTKSGSNLYVNSLGDTPSNDNIFATQETTMSMIKTLCASENVNLYIEGITLIGGKSSIYFSNSASYKEPRIVAKNCKFVGCYDSSWSENCISILGASAYFQNCEAKFGARDGFNYHSANNTPSKFIEYNCIAHNNGIDNPNPTGTDNGTTAHDGSIGIRLKGVYYQNFGANIADVHDNTRTLNIGCLAFDSKATQDGDYSANFSLQQSTTTKAWIYDCKFFGAKTCDVFCGRTGVIYLNNSEWDKIQKASTGTIYIDGVEYTP